MKRFKEFLNEGNTKHLTFEENPTTMAWCGSTDKSGKLKLIKNQNYSNDILQMGEFGKALNNGETCCKKCTKMYLSKLI